MADLEERFFQRNVPGRYSQWDDGGGDADRGDDIDGEVSRDGVDGRAPAPAATTAPGPAPPPPPPRPGGRNTGAKGVISDYRAAREEEARRRRVERAEREAALVRAARGGGDLRPGEVSISTAAAEERRRREERAAREGGSDGGSGSDRDDDDYDDEFLRRYRQRRLEELRSASRPPLYGEIVEVTPAEFSDAVDASDPRTPLVVHIYEPTVTACVVLNRHLESIARSIPRTRFMRLRASDAGIGADPVGLPSVAIYRGGELVHNLTPVTERLPHPTFSEEDVLALLESCGAGDKAADFSAGSESAARGSAAEGAATSMGGCVDGEYDSDDAELDEFCSGFSASGM